MRRLEEVNGNCVSDGGRVEFWLCQSTAMLAKVAVAELELQEGQFHL